MSTGPLPEQVNPRKLAMENRKLEGFIPLSKFTRLAEVAVSTEGQVEAKLEFRKGKKQRALIIASAEADISLLCQNCLEPSVHHLDISFRYQVLDNPDQLADLEEEEDGIVANEGLLRMVDILEDELLLGLPMVARHGEGECEAIAFDQPISSETQTSGEERQTPFADLANMLKSRDTD